MTNDPVDLLQIKIEQARAKLSVETQNAIAAVDWRAAIIGMRASKGYTFEQLGDLETETELLLCGLISPESYPKELSDRMRIPKAEADGLVNEMNDLVFTKIRAELVKNAERKRIFASKSAEEKDSNDVLSSHGIEIIPARNATQDVADGEKPKTEVHQILAEKLSGSFKTEVIETKHSLDNISKTNTTNTVAPVNLKPKIPSLDPYREKPE